MTSTPLPEQTPEKKVILHLCADTGSDTYFYQQDSDYEVILIGKDIGVENYHPDRPIYGIIANPVCTEFSTARSNGKARNPEEGMLLVKECMRIVNEAMYFGELKFYVIENPARGVLHKYLGLPVAKYEPWHYGSPWSKQTALWGDFNMPKPLYDKWHSVRECFNPPPYQKQPSASQSRYSIPASFPISRR